MPDDLRRSGRRHLRIKATSGTAAKTATDCLKKKPTTRQVNRARRDVPRFRSWPNPKRSRAAVANIRAVMSGRFSAKYWPERWLTPRIAAHAITRYHADAVTTQTHRE